jgi:predicted ATPase/transcriptional regulator with XRE-family HTH domain
MTKDLAYSFGTWMRHRRKTLDLTQPELAERLHCSVNTIKKLETNARRPSKQLAELLAVQFHIPEEQRTLFVEYARGDWRSVPAEIKEDTPWRVLTKSPRSNLPSALISLIGREHELAILGEYLSDPGKRLITLIGPPGIGKTQLSLQVGRQVLSDFANGVFFVALASLEDPTLMVPTVIQTLGFMETPAQDSFERLKSVIGNKQILIVLDNAEHLIEEAAIFVSDLLLACPRLKILITSREALRVPGEWLYPVPVLSVPTETELKGIDMETAWQYTALTLFAERARAVRPDFTLTTDNIESVATICAHLDGLPLAIELIAVQVRLMSPQTLLSYLSGQFVLSAGDMRAVSARQKTLHNAIRWSYDLLMEDEQKLFMQLSVFAGGFTVEAAQEIAAGEDGSMSDIRYILEELVNKSLVTIENPPRNNEPQNRYGMLETIREYAREKLDDSGEAGDIRNRHAEFFAQLAEEADSNRFQNQTDLWINQIENELDNIRAAIHWSIMNDNALVVFRLLAPLNFYVFSRGGRSDLHEYYDKALALKSGMARTRMRAKTLNGLGLFLWTDEYSAQQQKSRLEEALSIGQELEDKSTIATSLWNLGYFEMARGDFGKARELLIESLNTYRDVGTSTEIDQGFVLSLLGDIAFYQNDIDQAVKIFEEDIDILREIENKTLLAFPVRRLAQLVSRQGDYEQAILLCTESIMLNQQVEDQYGMVASLAALAGIYLSLEWAEIAAKLFGAVSAYLQDMNLRLMPIDQQQYEHNINLLHSLLNDPSLEKAWMEGKTMTIEQAVAYMLEKLDS